MRRKRKQATAVLLGGVVHAIGDTKRVHAFKSVLNESRDDNSWWGVWGEYPLLQNTHAQRKSDRAKLLKKQADTLIRLACEPGYVWRKAPRTRGAVNCMTCLVVSARVGS